MKLLELGVSESSVDDDTSMNQSAVRFAVAYFVAFFNVLVHTVHPIVGGFCPTQSRRLALLL